MPSDERLTEALDLAGEEAARLRLANDGLRASNRALREANAYYSPEKNALLFGYFPASLSGGGYRCSIASPNS